MQQPNGILSLNPDEPCLVSLRGWFEQYVATFHSEDPEIQYNFDLKRDHTRRVCMEILDIGNHVGLGSRALFLAEILAWFHDIGRFEQYARYGTFFDLKSEDHAALGVHILKEHHVLRALDEQTQDLILRCISYHNRASLPAEESETCLFFSRLLRDADKLDIWRVLTRYYHEKGNNRNQTIELDLEDAPEVSQEVYEDLLAGRIVRSDALRTLTDFKFLQMGWVYDLSLIHI